MHQTVEVEAWRDGHVGKREEYEAQAHEYTSRPIVCVEPFVLIERRLQQTKSIELKLHLCSSILYNLSDKKIIH